MFYVPQDESDTTANISYCSGAATEVATVQAEASHCLHYSTSVQWLQWTASPWLKPAKNLPNRTRSSATACGGFRKVSVHVALTKQGTARIRGI